MWYLSEKIYNTVSNSVINRLSYTLQENGKCYQLILWDNSSLGFRGGNESKQLADCLLVLHNMKFVHCQKENVLSRVPETLNRWKSRLMIGAIILVNRKKFNSFDIKLSPKRFLANRLLSRKRPYSFTR